jgi:hypothetical protein
MQWTMPDLIDFKRAAVIALNEYLYGKANPGYLGSLCRLFYSSIGASLGALIGIFYALNFCKKFDYDKSYTF